MRVAIDGPAGSGKSTIAHALSKKRGLTLLDTGAMYRSVTLACHERGVAVDDAQRVAELAKTVHISFGLAVDGTQTVVLDGADVTSAIRTPKVDADVSAVAANAAVREAMVEQQRELAGKHDVVAEGRDIGTVVFPDAEVKVFLTADPAARAHRRAVQRAGGDAAHDPEASADPNDEKAILDDLLRRDKADSSREVAPLKPAEDAVHIDSSDLTVEEVVAKIEDLMDSVSAHETHATGPAPAPRHMREVALSSDAVDGQEMPREPKAAVEPQPAEASAEDGGKTQEKDLGDKKKDPGENKRDADNGVCQDKGPQKEKTPDEDPMDKFYDNPMREFSLPNRALLGATIVVCGVLSKLLWPWRIEDGEKLWNAEGGRMVVMNHVSMLDPVVLVVTDYAHGRRMRPIYKSEFDKHGIVRWFFGRIGAIPVKRGTADIKAVRRAQRALQRGEDVLVFPEGTRIYSDEQEVTLHAGFALMAQLAKAPVLPVAIVGARDGAPGGNKPLRPHRVFLRAGDEIRFEDLGVKGRKKQASAMEEKAMGMVYALREALRKDHPGKM